MLRAHASRWNEEILDVFEVKIEKSEKAGSGREFLYPGMSSLYLCMELEYCDAATP